MRGGNFITRRDGIWQFVRRVPLSVAHLDKRGIAKQSTKIRVADDPRGTKARKVAERINEQFDAYWRGLGEGQAAEAKARYDEARRRARTFGFDYIQNADLAASRPTEEIVKRYDRLSTNESEANAAALLGGEAPPQIMLSSLFEEFEALTVVARRDMSPDQIRKWRYRQPGKRYHIIFDRALRRLDTFRLADLYHYV